MGEKEYNGRVKEGAMNKSENISVPFFRLDDHGQKRLYPYLLILVHNHNDSRDLLQEIASILLGRFTKFDSYKNTILKVLAA